MSKKVPKTEKNINAVKIPQTVSNANSYLDKAPTWRFNRLDVDHPKWSMKKCCDFNTVILERLVAFERQTWSEITIDAKKANHHINVSRFIKEAQKRLDELKIVDDELFSLRLSGTERLFGILTDGVFQIIWYDCNHEICPSHKKHT